MRWANTSLIILFLLMLWLPTLDTLFHLDRSTFPRENRLLAQLPELRPSLGDLKEFIGGLDAYFNDHFGWRNRLIHLHRRLQLGVFPQRSGPKPTVIIGRNGWLFVNEGGTIEHYQGLWRFSPQDLLDWQALLEHRRDWLAQLGIKFIVVVAPDKESVYSEQLPAWLKKVQPTTKLDQFYAYMHAHSSVAVVDLRPALREAKMIAPTYYQTDPHWNYFGGFVASQEIIKCLSKQMPELEPLSLSSFNLEMKPIPCSNLAAWAEEDVNENCAVFLLPKPDLPRLEIDSKPTEFPSFFAHFTRNPKASGNAIVLGDSMADCMAPFLGYHFGVVSYYDLHVLSKRLILQEKPDVVIIEMLEKTFYRIGPKGYDDRADYVMRQFLHDSPTNQPPTR